MPILNRTIAIGCLGFAARLSLPRRNRRRAQPPSRTPCSRSRRRRIGSCGEGRSIAGAIARSSKSPRAMSGSYGSSGAERSLRAIRKARRSCTTASCSFRTRTPSRRRSTRRPRLAMGVSAARARGRRPVSACVPRRIAISRSTTGPEACVITAFDARTGKETWRTRTIPKPGDETWGDAPYEKRWHVGSRMVPSYDRQLKRLYLGTPVTSPARAGRRATSSLASRARQASSTRSTAKRGSSSGRARRPSKTPSRISTSNPAPPRSAATCCSRRRARRS